jgi:thiosulfate/3-mercaptopyruvate sulfurtransferase
MDLEKDLSGPVQAHGGRHPLPDIHQLSQKLEEIGIDEKKTVIAYDDQGGAMASRFWWLLAFLGHPKTFVMNGTFQMWKEKGYPVSKEAPQAKVKTKFQPDPQYHLIADMNEVREKLNSEHTILVDSREEKRYLGEEEPIDSVAGHIPGAKHYFWKDVLDSNGKWKDAKQLEQHFSALPKEKAIIVYCGSGVTAAPNVLALSEAGFPRVKLYVGSWSDWITSPENPIARGKE